jgi:hypothetical protein
LSLAFACSALAQVRVMPRIPTSLTPVTIYYNYIHGMPATALGAAVRRVGPIIHVYLSIEEFRITSATEQSYIAVPIGMLEGGDYEIRTHLAGKFVTMPLRVLDATTFPLGPPGAAWYSQGDGCGASMGAPHFLEFEEVVVRVAGARPVVVAGPLFNFWTDECGAAPRLTDVEVTLPDGEKVIAHNAFTFYDEFGPTRAFVFEDVFVPIYFNGRGATGDWRTELALRATDSAGPREVRVTVRVSVPSKGYRVDDRRTVIAASDIGNQPGGFYLHVGRNSVERLRPELRVWDASAPEVTPTRIPVVREQDWLAGLSRIEAIPLREGTRVTVRVYAPDGDLDKIIMQGKTREIIRPVRDAEDRPRFASFDFAVGKEGFPVTTFFGDPFGTRYWVMITLTDPVTHQVTVLTPQREESRN